MEDEELEFGLSPSEISSEEMARPEEPEGHVAEMSAELAAKIAAMMAGVAKMREALPTVRAQKGELVRLRRENEQQKSEIEELKSENEELKRLLAMGEPRDSRGEEMAQIWNELASLRAEVVGLRAGPPTPMHLRQAVGHAGTLNARFERKAEEMLRAFDSSYGRAMETARSIAGRGQRAVERGEMAERGMSPDFGHATETEDETLEPAFDPRGTRRNEAAGAVVVGMERGGAMELDILPARKTTRSRRYLEKQPAPERDEEEHNEEEDNVDDDDDDEEAAAEERKQQQAGARPTCRSRRSGASSKSAAPGTDLPESGFEIVRLLLAGEVGKESEELGELDLEMDMQEDLKQFWEMFVSKGMPDGRWAKWFGGEIEACANSYIIWKRSQKQWEAGKENVACPNCITSQRPCLRVKMEEGKVVAVAVLPAEGMDEDERFQYWEFKEIAKRKKRGKGKK